jgi:hypothetical protein
MNKVLYYCFLLLWLSDLEARVVVSCCVGSADAHMLDVLLLMFDDEKMSELEMRDKTGC